MGLAETWSVSTQAQTRLLGKRHWILIVAWAAGSLAAAVAAILLSSKMFPAKVDQDGARTVAAVAIAFLLWRFINRSYGWMARRILTKAVIARSLVDPMRVSFGVEDATFTVKSEAGETRVSWPAVSEVAPTETHWIFMTGLLCYLLPRRFFADAAAEHAFIAAVLVHLNDPARARSRKAAAFVAASAA